MGGGNINANKDTSVGVIKLPAGLGKLVKSYIYGYPDGTFGGGNRQFDPGANITRSEAVAVVNRALGRKPDRGTLDALVANGTIFLTDVINKAQWDYYHIPEAAFDH